MLFAHSFSCLSVQHTCKSHCRNWALFCLNQNCTAEKGVGAKKSLFPSPTPLNLFLRSLGRNQPSTTLCTTASWAQSHQLLPCLGSPQRAEGPVLAAPSLVSAGHKVATKGLENYNNARGGPWKDQPRAGRPLAVALPGPWWAQPSPCAPPGKQVTPHCLLHPPLVTAAEKAADTSHPCMLTLPETQQLLCQKWFGICGGFLPASSTGRRDGN